MAGKKAGAKKVTVGNVTGVSGKVIIAAGNVYEGLTPKEVSLLLEQFTTHYRRKEFDGRCPYKGLDVFEEEDADLFFGRERLVEDLLSRVKESRTVFITGPSGSGKSSLVRAGLIHALKQGAIKGSERWLYEIMKPGREPIKELSLAFSRLKSPELAHYFQEHANDLNILNDCAESVLSGQKTQRFVLFVDQFEEVFTQVNAEEERLAFLNMLAHAGTVGNGRVIVLFAMRSDFVSNCAAYPMLNELLSQQFRQIGAMQPEELVSAIALPAKQVGLPIEDELIARIINDMKGEPGALPLMQFALKDLFDSQQGDVIALTLEDYLKHGGVQKSLERHADASLAALDEKSQNLARSIFSSLIEIGRGTVDTKRTALFDELVPANASAADVSAIVQKLADARLIITDEQAGKDTVTISHEKLIEAWPWLKKLVNENRDAIALQNEIANDAKEWDDHQRDPSYLYSGGRLISTIEQLESKKLLLGGLAQQFVQTADMRRRRTRVALSVAILSIIILLTSAVIIYNRQANESAELASKFSAAAGTAEAANTQTADLLKIAQANREFAEANTGGAEQQVRIARSGELAAQAVLERNNNPILSSLLSLEAFRLFDGPRTRALLMDSIQITPLVQYRYSERILAFSPTGKLFVAQAYNDAGLMFLDVETGKPVGAPLDVHGGTINSAVFSPDGNIFVSSGAEGIIFWDVGTHQPVGTSLDGGGDIAFSQDGKILASGSKKGFTLWDTSTHQRIGQSLNESWESIAISPDGKILALTKYDEVALWDVAKNRLMDQPSSDGPFLINFNNLAFSPDGKYFAYASHKGVILWDVSNHESAGTLTNENPEPILALAFSPDGRILVSGSVYSTITLWDVETRQPIGQPLSGVSGVSNVAFSSDGKYLVAGTEDGIVSLWNMDPLSWYQKICQKAERNFTQDEWKRYFPNEKYRVTCPQWPVEPQPGIAPSPTP